LIRGIDLNIDLHSVEVLKRYALEGSFSRLHEILVHRVGAKKQRIDILITIGAGPAGFVVLVENEVDSFPHFVPPFEHQKVLVVVLAREFFDPVKGGKTRYERGIGQKKKGKEFHVFMRDLSLDSFVDAEERIVQLVDGNNVFFCMISIQKRVHLLRRCRLRTVIYSCQVPGKV
jgi:hypothetical protein